MISTEEKEADRKEEKWLEHRTESKRLRKEEPEREGGGGGGKA